MERGRQLTEPVVVQAAAGQAARAAALAARLGLELHDGPRTPSTTPALVVGEAGLELRLGAGPAVLPRFDLLRAPRSGGSDPLYRAVLSGTETVVDATAGLGADSFHLAARGVEVTMIERSGVIWALLDDAVARARAGELGSFAAAAGERLTLIHGDAVSVLPELRGGVVLLDPMFPAKSKNAATNKGMELLRLLELAAGPQEESDLLRAARQSATRRVVVKRGRRDAPLAGVAPSGALVGRSVRFDLYAPV